MADAIRMPDVGKLLAASERRGERRDERVCKGAGATAQDRIVRREIFLYVDSEAAGPDPEGVVETCPYPYHLCEPCAEGRSRDHVPVESLYPQPLQSACEDCGAHSFRPWITGYDDAFTGEALILGLLPAAERSRRCGCVMYEALRYPMVVSDGPDGRGYRVYDDKRLISWADRRFADWEIVAGRRKGFERHGMADTPPSEADLIEMHRNKEV